MTNEANSSDEQDRRRRLGLLALGLLSALFFAAALASAFSSGLLSLGGGSSDRDARGGLPPGWATLDPLLPLMPSLRQMSDMRRGSERQPSTVLTGANDGGGALRLRARPNTVAVARRPSGTRTVVTPVATLPSIRPPLRLAVPRLPLVRTVVDLVPIAIMPPSVGDIQRLVRQNLRRAFRNLPIPTTGGGGLPIPSIPRVTIPAVVVPPVVIPPITVPGPLPGGTLPGTGAPLPGTGTTVPGTGGTPLPGTGTLPFPGTGALPLAVAASGSAPPAALTVTVLDSPTDPAFDTLVAASGTRVLESYTFRDGDIAGLAAQIDLRSRLFVADALRDGVPLTHVAQVSLSAPGAPAAASDPGARAPRSAARGHRGGTSAGAASADGSGSGAGGSSGSNRGGSTATTTGQSSGGASAGGSGPVAAGRSSATGRANGAGHSQPRSGGSTGRSAGHSRSSGPGRSNGRGHSGGHGRSPSGSSGNGRGHAGGRGHRGGGKRKAHGGSSGHGHGGGNGKGKGHAHSARSGGGKAGKRSDASAEGDDRKSPRGDSPSGE